MRVKMSKQPPPAPTASAVGPCPTVIQTLGRPGTGSLPSTIASPDHPPPPPVSSKRIFMILHLLRTESPPSLPPAHPRSCLTVSDLILLVHPGLPGNPIYLTWMNLDRLSLFQKVLSV